MSTTLLGLARSLFVPLLGIFLFFICLGYFYTLSSVFPANPRIANIALAIAVGVIIFILVRHSGRAFADASRYRHAGSFVAALISYFALFALSGWGAVTAAMFVIEGPVIVREKAAEMAIGFSRLDETAKARLPVKECDEMRATVNDLKGKLNDEIYNRSGGGFCGIGDEAKRIISQISRHLATVGLIAGTDRDHDCRQLAKLQTIESQYASSIDTALANHPMIAQLRIGDREALRQQIGLETASFVPRLSSLSASNIQFRGDPGVYQDAHRLLSEANTTYGRLISRLNTLLGVRTDLPERFDLTSVESISSGVSVINAVVQRLYRPSTWLILLGAFALDLVMSLMVALLYDHYRSRLERRKEIEDRLIIKVADGNAEQNIRFLWLPPSYRWT